MKNKKTLESRFQPGMGAGKIVEVCGMSGRPEYYSGRGATRSDLNYEMLERIYLGVKKTQGINASEEFVQMVADIPKMSATDFLLNFYNLERNEWKWDKRMTREESGIYVDGRNDLSKFATGVMSIMGSMSGMNAHDDTRYIKGEFLMRHGIKIESGEGEIECQ